MILMSFRRTLIRSGLALALTFGAHEALALNVLTFDTGNPERNSTVGTLGFRVTQVGASGVAGLDFADYDMIYVALSYEDFLGSAFGSRAGDLADFVAAGGGLVFGSPAIGGGSAGGPGKPGRPIQINIGVDLPGPGLPPPPSLPGPALGARDGAGSPEAVPEPGTWALMGLGLAGLAAWRRKRRA